MRFLIPYTLIHRDVLQNGYIDYRTPGTKRIGISRNVANGNLIGAVIGGKMLISKQSLIGHLNLAGDAAQGRDRTTAKTACRV